MTNADFERLVAEALVQDFSGWDFSWLHDRWYEEDPPWSYETIVSVEKQRVDSLLDMGTGSGAIALAIAPSDPNVVWVGTGEAFVRSNVSIGNGVYKSTDAGATWEHIGLLETQNISRIRVRPDNCDVAWVAALAALGAHRRYGLGGAPGAAAAERGAPRHGHLRVPRGHRGQRALRDPGARQGAAHRLPGASGGARERVCPARPAPGAGLPQQLPSLPAPTLSLATRAWRGFRRFGSCRAAPHAKAG